MLLLPFDRLHKFLLSILHHDFLLIPVQLQSHSASHTVKPPVLPPAYLILATSQENTILTHHGLLQCRYPLVSAPTKSVFLQSPTSHEAPPCLLSAYNNPTKQQHTEVNNQTYSYHPLPAPALRIHRLQPDRFPSVRPQTDTDILLPYHSSDKSRNWQVPADEDLPSRVSGHVLVHPQIPSAYNHAAYYRQCDQAVPIPYSRYDMRINGYHLLKTTQPLLPLQ